MPYVILDFLKVYIKLLKGRIKTVFGIVFKWQISISVPQLKAGDL